MKYYLTLTVGLMTLGACAAQSGPEPQPNEDVVDIVSEAITTETIEIKNNGSIGVSIQAIQSKCDWYPVAYNTLYKDTTSGTFIDAGKSHKFSVNYGQNAGSCDRDFAITAWAGPQYLSGSFYFLSRTLKTGVTESFNMKCNVNDGIRVSCNGF